MVGNGGGCSINRPLPAAAVAATPVGSAEEDSGDRVISGLGSYLRQESRLAHLSSPPLPRKGEVSGMDGSSK